jgi:hypothetical protein
MTSVPQQKTNLIIAAAAMHAPLPAPVAPELPRSHAARWRRASRRTLILAIIATAVPAGVTATVVKLSTDAPPKEAPLPTLGAGPGGHVIDRDPLPVLPKTVGEAYSRLAAPPGIDDRDNAGVRAIAGSAKQFGLSAGQARVLARVNGQRVWLIPGNGYLCIGVQDDDDPDNGVATSCATQADAFEKGMTVSNSENIYGILPDGVHQIEVTDDTGFRHVESVVDNVYVLAPVSATVRYRVGAADLVSFRVIA